MIKNLKEYRQHSAKLLTKGISAEESNSIKEELKVFKENNPTIFDKLLKDKWNASI